MKKRLFLFFVACFPLTSFATPWQTQGIYGDDNRREFYELDDFQRSLADSSVALIADKNLLHAGRRFHLKAPIYGQENQLCRSEPFFDQIAPAYCSGILVGSDLVLTAGHCVANLEVCKKMKFVFNFLLAKRGPAPQEIPAKDVYGCASIVSRESSPGPSLPPDGADYALIRLNRQVTDHQPARLAPTGGPRVRDAVAAFGYPLGLPLKFITSAFVRDEDPSTFRTNLDTYNGNSGSPVMNLATGQLEGILIEGDQDFERTPEGCYVSKRCPDDGCEGERVMKVDEILRRLGDRFRPETYY